MITPKNSMTGLKIKLILQMMRVEWLNIYKNILIYKNLNQILINIFYKDIDIRRVGGNDTQ